MTVFIISGLLTLYIGIVISQPLLIISLGFLCPFQSAGSISTGSNRKRTDTLSHFYISLNTTSLLYVLLHFLQDVLRSCMYFYIAFCTYRLFRSVFRADDRFINRICCPCYVRCILSMFCTFLDMTNAPLFVFHNTEG